MEQVQLTSGEVKRCARLVDSLLNAAPAITPRFATSKRLSSPLAFLVSFDAEFWAELNSQTGATLLIADLTVSDFLASDLHFPRFTSRNSSPFSDNQ
jgi:hypothetical protein